MEFYKDKKDYKDMINNDAIVKLIQVKRYIRTQKTRLEEYKKLGLLDKENIDSNFIYGKISAYKEIIDKLDITPEDYGIKRNTI